MNRLKNRMNKKRGKKFEVELFFLFIINHFPLDQQIASLAIRTGNGLLLKGETEAKRSNAILHKV